jgi:hypothetical protein
MDIMLVLLRPRNMAALSGFPSALHDASMFWCKRWVLWFCCTSVNITVAVRALLHPLLHLSPPCRIPWLLVRGLMLPLPLCAPFCTPWLLQDSVVIGARFDADAAGKASPLLLLCAPFGCLQDSVVIASFDVGAAAVFRFAPLGCLQDAVVIGASFDVAIVAVRSLLHPSAVCRIPWSLVQVLTLALLLCSVLHPLAACRIPW